MVRTAAALQISLILLSLAAFAPYAPVSAESNDSIIIDSAVTWENDDTISGSISIIEGGSLTILDATISMEPTSSITIESNATLRVEGGSLLATDPADELIGGTVWEENKRSKIRIPSSEYSEEFILRLTPAIGRTFSGVQAYVGEAESVELTGSEGNLTIPAGEEDIWVGFDAFSFAQFTLSKVEFTTDSGEAFAEYQATDLEYSNLLILGDSGFTIDSSGVIEFVEATIDGAMISNSGNLAIDDSVIHRSTPIHLTDDSAEIDVRGESQLVGSHEDHYIHATPEATILWGDLVQIEDGVVDRWERSISGQYVKFDAVGVYFRISGTSPTGDLEITNATDFEGISYINGGQKRIIEIGWANGTVTTENTMIEIISYRTAWNPDTDESSDNYGPVSIPLTWQKETYLSQNTPNVQWESLTLVQTLDDEEGEVSTARSQPVVAVLANRGTAAANLYFTCEVAETGETADIGGYQNARIDAGESVEVNFGWRRGVEGDASLSCRILTPTQLVEDDAFGGGSKTTASILWVEPTEEESLAILPLLIVIALMMAGGAALYIRRLNQINEEDEGFDLYDRDE